MADEGDQYYHASMYPTQDIDGPVARELSLYTGVSNRTRGWKTKKSDKVVERYPSCRHSVRRWDGASMSSSTWDNLKRDPELWCRDGNCYIHLYGQGQSRRGPTFKVPFSGLLEASCYPFFDRFMAQNLTTPLGYTKSENGDPARQSRIELFIPAPPRSNKQEAYRYHLATRNFIAFIFRRSVVGENLGRALITLMHTMHEFRLDEVDNVQDLINYMDEEGYLNFRNHPAHALAILHLAEAFQLESLYIDAFAHCCGMGDKLLAMSEYQLLSPGTRKLIRCARVEMNLRLGQSGNMIGTFLQYELSEAHLGLYAGARAHLERFRSLLRDFYTAKFDSFPPPSVDPRTTIFEVDVLRTMRIDFEALYQYLVDESYDTTQDSPFLAEGGICTLQIIRSFDLRHEFETLFHPLPLLPRVSQEQTSRLAWLGARMKLDRRRKDNTHQALLKATNKETNLMNNGLVRLYRQFEKDLVYLPTKADKLENLGPMDSRKIRWILIYATYQALRQATETPLEVRNAADAPYHLCISTYDLPPWDEERSVRSLVRSQTEHIARSSSASATRQDPIRTPSPPKRSFEIKPDIDYLALAYRDNAIANEAKDEASRLRRATSWGGSLRSNLSRTLTTRRSSTKLTKPPPIKADRSSIGAQYRQIVVQGYGNGMNDIKAALINVPLPKPRPVTADEDPVSSSPSRYSSHSDLRRSEENSGEKTPDTSISVAEPGVCNDRRRHSSSSSSSSNSHYAQNRDSDPDRKKALPRTQGDAPHVGLRHMPSLEAAPNDAVSWSTRRQLSSFDSNSRKDKPTKLMPPPHKFREVNCETAHIEMPIPKAPKAFWGNVRNIMEVKASNWKAEDVHPEWEQYTDLGGLTEMDSWLKPSTSALKAKSPTTLRL
ncbi:hypothetical protein M426DRAFT_98386 [Hypoxylon sp. CI-4A]|nr:hypothetical protein M426DRAFT_98386 [Hypoxylon sp. CI-4A]